MDNNEGCRSPLHLSPKKKNAGTDDSEDFLGITVKMHNITLDGPTLLKTRKPAFRRTILETEVRLKFSLLGW